MCSITQEVTAVISNCHHIRVPGICCWFLRHSICSHWSFQATVLLINLNIYTDQCEPIIILLVLTQQYRPRCWHFDSSYCHYTLYDTRCRKSQMRFVLSPLLLHQLRLRVFQSIFTFSHWLGHLSTILTKDEITNTVCTFTPKVVAFILKHRTPGRRDLDFTFHLKEDGDPWVKLSESRPDNLAGVVFRNRILSSFKVMLSHPDNITKRL